MASVLRRFNVGLLRFDRLLGTKCRRTLLSESYSCKEAWEKRLESPILQKIDPEQFSIMLQDKVERTGIATAIDLDILANKLDKVDPIQLDFVQNLFYKFRKTSECTNIMDSTPYAYIRALLHFGMTDTLLEILEDKINYGMFLDYYTANLLLDHFIESGAYQDAARVAYDLMRQEDFSHPLCRALSWYACHKHWKNPVQKEEEVAEAEDDEEEWIKVKYLETPWYDDHFDLSRDELLLGKTFTMVTEGDDALGRSYQIIGLALYEKFQKAIELLTLWEGQGIKEIISQEALEQIKTSLENLVTKEPPAEEIDAGLLTLEDVTPYFTEEQKADLLQKFQEIENKLSGSDKVVQDLDSESILLARVKDSMAKCESKDIAEQTELFQKWESERQQLLQTQIKEFQIKKKKAALAKRLRALQEREEKLSYFEQLGKIKLGVERRDSNYDEVNVESESEVFVPPPQVRGKATF